MPWPKGKPRSEETKRKIGAGCKSAWTQEKRQQRSSVYTGDGNPFFGKTHTLEAREKMTVALTGRTLSEGHRAKVSASLVGNQRAKGNSFSWTDQQKRNLAEARRGDKNPAWKGGVTSAHVRERNSAAYREWRTSVFNRDDYTCVDCGSRNGNGKAIYLEAHHVKPFAEFPEHRFEIGNGKTLCVECHNLVHRSV